MTNQNITDLHIADTCDEDHEHLDDEIIVNTMLEHVFAGSHHQMQAAMELTKIIVQQNPGKNSEEILKAYQDALKVVMDSSPIPSLLHLLGAELT
jgi:hypothetical protein